jgi:membrane-bound lytic murein transglycosylase B
MKVLIAACALLAVLGLQDPPPPPPPPPPAAAPAGPSFEEFLAGVRAEAIKKGISEATLDKALANLQPEPVVVARDRAQPELIQSLDDYVSRRLNPKTINSAREAAVRLAPLLAKVDKAYGVQPALMVAIWGLESNFGTFTGTYPTIASLATLAYDARRPLFRSELFDALMIVERRKMDPADLKGSWAGAMGQPQFMPSSFLRHAVDFDGDQTIDIWTSEADVFGSMANYLRESGWRGDERWGREVKITRAVMAKVDRTVPMRKSGCRATRELTVSRPVDEWSKLGVVLAGGGALPKSTIPASLVRGKSRYFLVYRNYEAILAYNCSNSYAVSVGLLSDRVASQ